MSKHIDTIISAMSLVVAILGLIRDCCKDSSPASTKPQTVINNIYVPEIPDNPTSSGYFKNRWLGKPTFIIITSFAFSTLGLLFFSVKPISSTLALFHILVVVSVVCITLRAQKRIGLNYYLLYLLFLISLIAIVWYFSSIETVVPFLSFEINKAYLYLVLVVALACFSWLSNYMLSAAYGYPINNKYFSTLACMFFFLAAVLTGLFEKVIAAATELILLWADRFFHM